MTINSSTQVETPAPCLLAEMNQQSILLAKKLHKVGYIYALYGALDGLSLSYSMLKYSFDMLSSRDATSSDLMHDWMLSPIGWVSTTVFSLALISVSTVANYFADKDKNKIQRFMTIMWPYWRDSMKALKNAYKGFRSTVQVIKLLNLHNLNPILIPIGIILGVLSALERMWLRHYSKQRKELVNSNKALLAEIKKAVVVSLALEDKCNKAGSQSLTLRRKMLCAAAFGGVVDGLYLYVGILLLASLPPAALIALVVFSSIYFLCNVVTRLYEEYDYQNDLLITETQIALALCGKKLNAALKGSDVASVNSLALKCIQQQDLLRKLSTRQDVGACILGIKHGLIAYGVIASAMFAVAIITTLTATIFPPALLIIAVSLGLALMIGFSVHSLWYAHIHQKKQQISSENWQIKLTALMNHCIHKGVELDVKMLEGMIEPAPKYLLPARFEVARSFFSGMNKGSKAIDFTMNPLQERDMDGHYRDTPIMLAFSWVSAVIHAIVLGLRAQVYGFGRDKDKGPKPNADVTKPDKPENIQHIPLGKNPCNFFNANHTVNSKCLKSSVKEYAM